MIDTEDYNHEYIQQWVISGTTVLSVAPPANRIVATDLTPQDAILIADAPLLLEEVKRLREGIQNICDTVTDTNVDGESMTLTRLTEMIE